MRGQGAATVGNLRVTVPVGVRRTGLALSVASLTALVWLVLWLTDASLHAVVHVGMPVSHGGPLVASLVFIAAWAAMTVAMMLPTTLPILATVDALARDRQDRVLLLTLVSAGYSVVWVAFGGVAWVVAQGVHALATADAWTGLHLRPAPILLAVAGAFQFSAVKYRCLDKCRSPVSFVLSYWRGARHRWHVLRLGVGHGLFCVGCCWALMLLMFAVGTAHLAWMLVLGGVMAIEKNMPWGRRISTPLGVVLLGAAFAMWTAA